MRKTFILMGLTTILLARCSSISTDQNEAPVIQDIGVIDEPSDGTADNFEDIEGKVNVFFTLNVQEFMEPELSLSVVEEVMDLHEKYSTPVDIFFADFIVQKFAESYDYIFDELADDSLFAVSYHVRPPLPYAGGYNSYNWSNYSQKELHDLLLQYETFTLDWTSGELLDEKGGYSFLKSLIGYAPIAAGVKNTDDEVEEVLSKIYEDLGATFAVQHAGSGGFGKKDIDFGETSGGLLLRPESLEIKLFEMDADEAIDTIEAYLSANDKNNEDIYINIKMHDKDFFASDSAWSLIYARKSPPYNLGAYKKNVSFLSDSERAEVLERYEEVLKFIINDSRFKTTNLLELSKTSSSQ